MPARRAARRKRRGFVFLENDIKIILCLYIRDKRNSPAASQDYLVSLIDEGELKAMFIMPKILKKRLVIVSMQNSMSVYLPQGREIGRKVD